MTLGSYWVQAPRPRKYALATVLKRPAAFTSRKLPARIAPTPTPAQSVASPPTPRATVLARPFLAEVHESPRLPRFLHLRPSPSGTPVVVVVVVVAAVEVVEVVKVVVAVEVVVLVAVAAAVAVAVAVAGQ